MLRKDSGTECLIGNYLPGNVVSLLCCWKITSSAADTVTLILLCGCLRKEIPAKYKGLGGTGKLFSYYFQYY